MTNDVIRAVVITGKYAVQSSPREKRNSRGCGFGAFAITDDDSVVDNRWMWMWMIGECLNAVQHCMDHVHVLLRHAQDCRSVPQNVGALRDGDCEGCGDRGGENKRCAQLIRWWSTRIYEPMQKLSDEFRLFATEPMSMPICMACETCSSVYYKAKYSEHVQGHHIAS